MVWINIFLHHESLDCISNLINFGWYLQVHLVQIGFECLQESVNMRLIEGHQPLLVVTALLCQTKVALDQSTVSGCVSYFSFCMCSTEVSVVFDRIWLGILMLIFQFNYITIDLSNLRTEFKNKVVFAALRIKARTFAIETGGLSAAAHGSDAVYTKGVSTVARNGLPRFCVVVETDLTL